MSDHARFLSSVSALALAAALAGAPALAQTPEEGDEAAAEAVAFDAGVTFLDPISIFATLNPIPSFDYRGR